MNHPESDNLSYKGYVIEPMCNQLKAGGWDTEFNIMLYHEGKMSTTPYYPRNTFDTYEEARAHCHATGMLIIDDAVPGVSPLGR